MKITMLHTRRGVADGFTIKKYEAKETYDLPEGLACDFVRKGYAVHAESESIVGAAERLYAACEVELTRQAEAREHAKKVDAWWAEIDANRERRNGGDA